MAYVHLCTELIRDLLKGSCTPATLISITKERQSARNFTFFGEKNATFSMTGFLHFPNNMV